MVYSQVRIGQSISYFIQWSYVRLLLFTQYILITLGDIIRSFMLTRKGLPDWEILYKTQGGDNAVV